MTDHELAAFYRRYNACCNEHRFEDLAEFVAPDVAIDGTERGLDAYAAELRAVVRAFPDYRWELRRLVIEAPWIAAHLTDTGTHRESFRGVQATGRSVAVPGFAVPRPEAFRSLRGLGGSQTGRPSRPLKHNASAPLAARHAPGLDDTQPYT
jgi:predicted ester cyclase